MNIVEMFQPILVIAVDSCSMHVCLTCHVTYYVCVTIYGLHMYNVCAICIEKYDMHEEFY